MPTFIHDRLSFHYRDAGSGLPFVFQHGLGGDVSQPFGLFQPPEGIRLLAMDCRGHGETRPVGDEAKIALTAFADDLAAWLDFLAIQPAVIGGISMGAAVALHFTLRNPQRVAGLVLSRPAWLAGPMESNARLFGSVASLIRQYGGKEGWNQYRQTPEYAELARDFPDTAASIQGQFLSPRAEDAVTRLERLPSDSPCQSLELLAQIGVPTLVLGNRRDPIHPFTFAEILASKIPGATLVEIASKNDNLERHQLDVQQALTEFLNRYFLHAR